MVWKNDKSENFQQVSTDFGTIREGKFTSLSVLSQLLLDNSREGGVDRLLAGILLVEEEVQGGVTAHEGGSEPVLLLDQNIQQVGIVIVIGVRSGCNFYYLTTQSSTSTSL